MRFIYHRNLPNRRIYGDAIAKRAASGQCPFDRLDKIIRLFNAAAQVAQLKLKAVLLDYCAHRASAFIGSFEIGLLARIFANAGRSLSRA